MSQVFHICSTYGLVPTPAQPQTIVRFLIHLSSSCKYCTIMNYLSAINVLHRHFGHGVTFQEVFTIKLGASPYFGWCQRTETPNHSRHTQAHLPSSVRWRRLRLLGCHSYRLLYIFPQVKSRPQVCAGLRLFQKLISFRLFYPLMGTGNFCAMV